MWSLPQVYNIYVAVMSQICIPAMSQIIAKTFGFLSHRLSWKSQTGMSYRPLKNAGRVDMESEAMSRKASKKRRAFCVSRSGSRKRILSGKLQIWVSTRSPKEVCETTKGSAEIHFPKHIFVDCKYTPQIEHRYQPKIFIFESGDTFSKAHHFWYPCSFSQVICFSSSPKLVEMTMMQFSDFDFARIFQWVANNPSQLDFSVRWRKEELTGRTEYLSMNSYSSPLSISSKILGKLLWSF